MSGPAAGHFRCVARDWTAGALSWTAEVGRGACRVRGAPWAGPARHAHRRAVPGVWPLTSSSSPRPFSGRLPAPGRGDDGEMEADVCSVCGRDAALRAGACGLGPGGTGRLLVQPQPQPGGEAAAGGQHRPAARGQRGGRPGSGREGRRGSRARSWGPGARGEVNPGVECGSAARCLLASDAQSAQPLPKPGQPPWDREGEVRTKTLL